MKKSMIAGAALTMLALAGCNRDGGANQAAPGTNGQSAGLPVPPTRPAQPTPPPTTPRSNNPAGLNVDVVSATNTCISPEDQQRPITAISAEQRRAVVACLNAVAVRQIEGQLPRQIDSATRLDRITAEGVLLTYHYTITQPRNQLPPNAAELLSQMAQRNVCAQQAMRQTLMLGGAYAYRWVDTSGAEIQRVRIDAC